MVPTNFAESNDVLNKPSSMSDDECESLCVYRGPMLIGDDSNNKPFSVVISCWKLNKSEVDELIKTGRLWLIIVGETMPPVAPQIETPFKKE